MKVLAAYLLLVEGGNSSPSGTLTCLNVSNIAASDITDLLATVGIEAEDSRIESLLSEVSGKSIDELIAEGSSKLGSVPSGGGGGASSAATEEKAEEKKEEEAEESDGDMGFGLFD